MSIKVVSEDRGTVIPFAGQTNTATVEVRHSDGSRETGEVTYRGTPGDRAAELESIRYEISQGRLR